MNCKHYRIRTKKKVHYKYCVLLKKIIQDDCYNCINKEYKMHNNLKNTVVKSKKCTVKYNPLCKFISHKHKLTKATEIPMKVKKVVWERDGHACIYCGKYVDVYYANSHYIKRSKLGMGIEQNVVCACPTCHYKYDFKDFNGAMKNYTKMYLSRLYDEWNEDDLVYRKS